MGSFMHIKKGDVVTRRIAGAAEMTLQVTDVTDTHIVCGAWQFDRKSGVEEDGDLGWGVQFGVSGSCLVEAA